MEKISKIMYQKRKKTSFVYFVYSLALLVFFSFVISLLSSPNSYIEDTWQNYATFDFEQDIEVDEDGKEVLVNYISTPQQLAGAFLDIQNGKIDIGTISNKRRNYKTYTTLEDSVYRLKNNIDLSTPVATGSTGTHTKKLGWSCIELPSGYTIDGNSFVISGLKFASTYSTSQNIGFISINNGTIKDLYFQDISIKNGQIDDSATNTGAVCGQNNGTIQDVTIISGTVTGNTYKNDSDRIVGGVCGNNTGDISHCLNLATVSVGKYIGGIAGKSTSGSITNCYNHGNICEPHTNKNVWIGGIVGNSSKTIIESCQNLGEINSYFEPNDSDDSSVRTDEIMAGGIVGYCDKDTQVQKCENDGIIDIGNQNIYRTYAGGIVGYSLCDITACFNKGSVTAKASKEQHLFDDVQRGFYDSSFLDYWDCENIYYNVNLVEEVNCKNYNIDYSYIVYAYSGGIVGYSNSNVLYCINTGNIQGGEERIDLQIDMRFEYTEHDLYDFGGGDLIAECVLFGSIVMRKNSYAQPIGNLEKDPVDSYHQSDMRDKYDNILDIELDGGSNLFNPNEGLLYYDIIRPGFSHWQTVPAYDVYINYYNNVVEFFIFNNESGSREYIVSLYVEDTSYFGKYTENFKNETINSTYWKQSNAVNEDYPCISDLYW